MAGLDLLQLRQFVVRPALAVLPPQWGGLAAENLLLGTELAESGGVYLHQLGAGPALGICQMEPATHDDCWVNFLNFQPALKAGVSSLLAPGMPPLAQLPGNLFYAVAMARVRYIRAPAPLPAAADAKGLCGYWKAIYNSELGAGVLDVMHIGLFQAAINAV